MEKYGEIELKQSPPWVVYVRTLEALFKEDPQVKVAFDEDGMKVKILVESKAKADALDLLLPETVDFGNVTLSVSVVPGNDSKTVADVFRVAFAGNKAVKDFVRRDGIFTNPMTYMVFKKEVVQYWVDNLGDPHGNRSTLYQCIAEEVFKDHTGVLFCTDNGEE